MKKIILITLLSILFIGCSESESSKCNNEINYKIAIDSIIQNYKPWSYDMFELFPIYVKFVETKDDGTSVCKMKLDSKIINSFLENFPFEVITPIDLEFSYNSNPTFNIYLTNYIIDRLDIRNIYEQNYESPKNIIDTYVKLFSYFLANELTFEIDKNNNIKSYFKQ